MPPFQGDAELEVFANLDVDLLESKSYEKVQPKVVKSKEPIKTTSLQELLAAARNGAGPMCDHCGATGKQNEWSIV